MSIKDGSKCNLSSLSMCVHNGTHVDEPYHFIQDGKCIDQLPLEIFVGSCWVSRNEGIIDDKDAKTILEKAKSVNANKRILVAGKATVTELAAQVFAKNQVLLLGNESQTVGPEDAPEKVHHILLGAGCVLLEGIVLSNVEEGAYILYAAPINLAGCDGAPCRAYLMN